MNEEKMKAQVYTKYGPPEVVQLREVEKPVPKAREVLIRVHASTVNRTDCGFRSAEYAIIRLFFGLFKPKRKVLGCEFAGEVVAKGEEVTKFNAGDKVFGFNDGTFGGHAEFMVMDERKAMTTLPANMSYAEAAPLTEGAHYALCDIRAAKISRGQQVLINGGTGAIGSAAVQLVKHLGASVTAVCATPHVALVRSLGADVVVDYTKEDFTKTDQKFDVVFDAVGKSSFGKCKPLLKKKGIYMSTELGKRSENSLLAMITPFLGGKRVLFPIPSITPDDILFIKGLVESGFFKPVIDRYYPLENIVEAYHYVETGQKIGNVVLLVHKKSEQHL